MDLKKKINPDFKATERQFSRLLDAAPDAMLAVDREGTIVMANSQVEALFGYRREELLGKKIEGLLPARYRSVHPQHRRDFFSRPRVRPMGPDLELFGLHKEGREFPVEIALSPLHTRAGSLVVSAIRDVSERKRTEESLRTLTSQLLRLQDEERRRIARELHDSAGQIVASLSMNLGTLDGKLDPDLKLRVGESVRLLDELSKQLRTISHLLHPPLLDELGLSSALRLYVEGFGERSKITTGLDIPESFGRLPQDVETTIFRVVQECLTNVHRHSGSTVANIRISRDAGEVLIEVRDRGKGIPLEEQKAMKAGGKLGVGIRGMRERLRQLGGSLQLSSGPEGTVVVARLPIASASTAVA